MKNDVVRLGVILFAITLVVALLLGCVNYLTAPVIAANNAKETASAIAELFPEATGDPETPEVTGDPKEVTNVYVAKNGDELVGVAVKVQPNGFGGAIEMMVGFNPDGSVTGIKILTMSETPGLGTKTQDPAFSGQFPGKKPELKVVKGAAGSETEISAVTGATISSTAVTNGVNLAYQAAQAYLK